MFEKTNYKIKNYYEKIYMKSCYIKLYKLAFIYILLFHVTLIIYSYVFIFSDQ